MDLSLIAIVILTKEGSPRRSEFHPTTLIRAQGQAARMQSEIAAQLDGDFLRAFPEVQGATKRAPSL
jgi:hypothetical protein